MFMRLRVARCTQNAREEYDGQATLKANLFVKTTPQQWRHAVISASPLDKACEINWGLH